ncbi:MAG: IclR family transcriptional regulator [Bryobacteraceae bacterium]|nr:IclR family transcriptional regulator [Bryobacteraceae bacterium]
MAERINHPVEVLQRGIRILEVLAEHPQGVTLSSLAAETGLPKSSVHRLLATWEQLRYVVRLGGGIYQLGLAALELTRKVSGRNHLTQLTQSQLRRLQSQTGESVYLALYRNGRVILVDAVESSHPLRVVVDLGERCFLHASAQGLCVAAWLEPDRLRELLQQQGTPRLTPKTDTDPATLKRRLLEVRERGYAINFEQTVEGSICLGAPLFAGREGAVLGSVGLSIPTPRASPERVTKCVELLTNAARELTELMADLVPEPDAVPRPDFRQAMPGDHAQRVRRRQRTQ